MIRRPPRSTQSRSSAASDVYKRQGVGGAVVVVATGTGVVVVATGAVVVATGTAVVVLSLIHISEPTRPY